MFSKRVSQMLHVWNIYLHLPPKWSKCRYIFHTWSIWVLIDIYQASDVSCHSPCPVSRCEEAEKRFIEGRRYEITSPNLRQLKAKTLLGFPRFVEDDLSFPRGNPLRLGNLQICAISLGFPEQIHDLGFKTRNLHKTISEFYGIPVYFTNLHRVSDTLQSIQIDVKNLGLGNTLEVVLGDWLVSDWPDKKQRLDANWQVACPSIPFNMCQHVSTCFDVRRPEHLVILYDFI